MIAAIELMADALQQMAAPDAMRSPQIDGAAGRAVTQGVECLFIACRHEVVERGRRCRKKIEDQLLCHISIAGRPADGARRRLREAGASDLSSEATFCGSS